MCKMFCPPVVRKEMLSGFSVSNFLNSFISSANLSIYRMLNNPLI